MPHTWKEKILKALGQTMGRKGETRNFNSIPSCCPSPAYKPSRAQMHTSHSEHSPSPMCPKEDMVLGECEELPSWVQEGFRAPILRHLEK